MDANWHRCLSAYLQTIEDHSGSFASRRTYASTLQRFLADRDPATVTRADVLDFMQLPSTSNRNAGSPVSAATKNQRVTIIRSFYTFASGYEIDDTPLFQRALPTTGLKRLKPSVVYRAMNTNELERLFAVMPKDTVKGLRDRALYLMYFWTARRRLELHNLRWQDIEPAIIDGRDTHVYRFRAKGTSRTVRTAELPAPAWQAIQRYLTISGRLTTIKPGDYLFVSVHPGQGYKDSRTNVPLNADYINREFKRYCQLAGLRSDLSLHSLRHASARMRYEAGASIRDIQQILGHASIATTDLYLRTVTGIADPTARLLEQRFGDL